MKISAHKLFRCIIRPLPINPEMGVSLHAAHAAFLSASAAWRGHKLIFISKAFVFCEREALLNKIFHELIIIIT